MKISAFVLFALIASPCVLADVVVIANPSVPDNMTANQVRDLFIGRGAQLPDGQAAVPIDMVQGDALREEFHTKVTGRSQAQLNSFWAQQVFTGKGQPPRMVDSAGTMKATVAATPGAVGYVNEADVDSSVKIILRP